MASGGRFDGKAVVITGATGDLGRVVSAAFADEGARLGLVYGHDRAGAEGLAHELTRDERVPAIAGANLALPPGTVEASVRDAARALESSLGRVDALVALAGLSATPELWQRPFDQISAADLHLAFSVDTVGTFLFAQALAPALRRARGAVVVTSSSAALYGDTLGLAFAPAKSANAGLVKLLARVLAPEVRVNGMAPGGIETSWTETLTPEQRKSAAAQSLVERFGKPAEVAQLVLHLADPGYLNGQVLALDGGIFPHPL
jgi:3-oxoacyl-[acyl-carrier protein] reductase